MNSSFFQRLSILFVLLALALPTSQREWQGTGSMNKTVMAEVHSNIDGNPISLSATKEQIDTIAQTISSNLNGLWDPAWNVVIVRSLMEYDTILYGYAFNNHWMWINGIAIPDSMTSDSVTYLIWKDYNCQNWKSLSNLTIAGTSFTNMQRTQLNDYMFTRINSDIWLEAHDFVEQAQGKSQLKDGAYTVVMSQDTGSWFCGYICLVNTNFVTRSMLQAGHINNVGAFYVFQTR